MLIADRRIPLSCGSPYTRTEQDVLESLLPPSVGRGNDLELSGAGDGGLAFGRRARLRSRRRLQEEGDGGSAFSTPDVVMPAHLHYYYHGCETRAAARDVMHRLPRRPCPSTASGGGGSSVGTAVGGGGRSGGTVTGSAATSTPTENWQQLVAGRVLIESGGAAVETGTPTPKSAGAPVGGSAATALTRADGGMTHVGIEWLTTTPFGRRNVSRVRVEDLCGGAVELVEKCDALLWRARRAVSHRLQRRGAHGLAQSVVLDGLKAGGGGGGGGGGGAAAAGSGGIKGGGTKGGGDDAVADKSSDGSDGDSSGRRLAGKKKQAKRAAAGAAAEVNASTLIRDLFISEYDGPGAQRSGCILSDDPGIASNRRFL